jgi:hypothetical protein
MDKMPTPDQVRNASRLASERINELTEGYRWKAENNIRFYEKLGMTTKQKEDFLAREFATIHWIVEIEAPSVQHLKERA